MKLSANPQSLLFDRIFNSKSPRARIDRFSRNLDKSLRGILSSICTIRFFCLETVINATATSQST